MGLAKIKREQEERKKQEEEAKKKAAEKKEAEKKASEEPPKKGASELADKGKKEEPKPKSSTPTSDVLRDSYNPPRTTPTPVSDRLRGSYDPPQYYEPPPSVSDRTRGNTSPPAPSPWAKPDLSFYEPPASQQVSRDRTDTSTPSVGYGGPQSNTVTSPVTPYQPPSYNALTRERQERRQPSSWSQPDILRDPYNAPNRPMVPTQAQGPAANNQNEQEARMQEARMQQARAESFLRGYAPPSEPSAPPDVPPTSWGGATPDRLRGEQYNAPNRPMVPTSPDWGNPVPPFASPVQGPANAPGGAWHTPQDQFALSPEQIALRNAIYGIGDGPSRPPDMSGAQQHFANLGMNQTTRPLPQQPPSSSWGGVTPDVLSGQYNAPNRPIIPVPPRPAGTDPSILNPKQDVLDAWERYKHTPEFIYAQAAAADRADYDAPPFWQGITEGAEQGRAVTGDSGTAVGGVFATLGGLVGLANQFGPTRAIVEYGQNALQYVSEVPTMVALNAPLRVSPTGKQFPSISQLVTAAFQEVFAPAAANNRGYLGRIEQGQQARAAVEQAIAETGDRRLALALRNISGANPLENVTATLNLLRYQEEYARQLEQEAATLAASDPVQAGELLLQAHELRSMTVADMIESRMDWRSELGYGLFDIAGEGIGALTAALRLLPEAKALSKAGKALNVTDDVALARLGVVGEAGKKLTQAVAEGPKAAKGEWGNIIAPFQNAGEKFINSKYLQWALTGKPTQNAKIALDAKEVGQTIFAMVGGITNKNDVKIILDNAANKPENLVRGIVGLSAETLGKFMENPPPNAGLRYHPGLVANDDIARRLALLNTVATEIPNMGSLNGPGKLNPIAFQAEMHELIVSAASRVHGGKQPGLPFGAAKVEMEITGNNAARVVYRDSKGKIIQAGAETTLVGAKQQLTDIQRGQNPPPNLLNAPYHFAKTFADIQKYIMNDVWLFDRPANTAGNALGAAVMAYAHDAYTLTPNSKIQEYFVRVGGGYMPSSRAYQTLPGVKNQARTMRDEIGGSAIGWIAAKVTGKGDNPVTQTTKALQDIPYGSTQIPLGNGIAVPVGEEAFSLRANYVPYQRVRNGAILESVNGTFVPTIAADQTIAPEMVNTIRDKLISVAEQNGKADILNEMRGWLGKQEIRGTLKQLGVPAELLLPDEARTIERMIADADIHRAAEVAQEISKVFAGARNRMGSVLHIDPGQPSVHWTDADMANEVGWLSDLMTEDGVKAGMDQATARAQSTELVTTYLEQQQQGIARVLGDFEPVATKPGAVGVVMDFYIDFMRKKSTARQAVDEASRVARSLNTPAAWQTKWQTNATIYNGLRSELDTLVENTRVSLQKIFNGDEYTPQYDWWETTRNYLNWDEQAFLTSRANPPIGRTAEADAAFQGYLDLNRQHVDNAQYELLGAFQAYPTMESFDIVRTAFRHTEALGAEAAFRAAELRNARRTGAISAEQYDRQINALWTKHFDDVALLNQTSGKIVVRYGLEREVASELRWVDNGQTWHLLEPSKNKNKWMARNEQTGKVEEFTVGELGDSASPFTVPKNVVDDFNRLGGDAGLDKAADALMQEIADSAVAPRPTRSVAEGEPANPERFVRDEATYQQWWEEQQTLPAEERLSYQEWWEREGYAVVNEGIVPPRTNPQVTVGEPDVAPRMPGYDDPAAVAAEPRFEQGNVSTYDQAASELTPRPAPVEPPVIDDPARRAQYTEIPVETPRRYSIPTDDEIRAAASDAGIATATKDGRPTDRHLVNSLNKRLNTKHTRLSQFTESERAAAIDALAATPAPKPDATPSAPATLADYGQGTRVEQTAGVTFGKPATYRGRKEITGTVEGAGQRIEVERVYIIEHAKGSNTYYVSTRPHYADDGRTLGSDLSVAEAKKVATTYLQEGARTSQGFGTGIKVDTSNVGKETLPLATGKPPKKIPAEVLGKEFDRMSTPEILREVREELLASGLSEREIADLAKNRADLISAIADARNVDVSTLDNMKRYDFAVPNISHMLGTRNNEDAYNLWQRILGTRNNGNARPPSTAEVAQVTINNLNDAERVLKSKLSEILVGEPNTLSNSQKIKILDEVANWVNKNMDGIDFKARRVGTAMADHVMLNAENRRDFDTMLSLMVPYHYFWSRMPSRLWSAALQKPSLVNWFYEMDRAINLENEQAGVPQRLEGTIGIPGTDKRINVARPLLHYAMGGAANYMTQNPYVEDDPTDNQVERWMKSLERNGFPGFNLYLKVAADMLDGKVDKNYSSVLNQLVPIVGAPVSSVQQSWTGQMPSKDGVMASVGFGPDVTPDGFALDVYRARRMVTWIAQEEGIDPTIAGFASQVIVNQYEGNDPGSAIPAEHLQEALDLAERSVKRAANERIMGRSSSYLTTMGVQSWTEAEQEMQRANQRYWASGYNPSTGTGGQQLQRDQLDADPSAPRSWTKGSETPGVDAQVSILYDQRAKLQEEKKAAEDAAVAALNMGTATRGEIYDARGQAGAPFKEQIDAIDAQIDELKEQQVNKVGDLQGKSQTEIAQALAPGNERPFAGANPQEVSQNFARGVMYQAIKIPGRPETPGDDASPQEWRTYGQELAAHYQRQEDYVVRSLTKVHTSDVLRENRGPVTYTDNQARDLWWHFQHDDELPAERARLEQIDRQQAARNATSDAQFANAKQRIKNGDKLLQTYLDTPDAERADLKETDWRYAAITLATYSPDVYDEMVEKFGKAAVQEYFSAYGKAPEYPGENASEEDLQAYYDASDEYDTTYAHRDEINLWLNGRYSWADKNSSPVLGQYDKGAEYDQAVAIFTERIFDIEREANEASLAGKWKEWRNANPRDYELLIGYQEWTKAARNEPQSAAHLPTARWGFNPATANASYASESDRSPFKGPPAQPMSVSDRLRQPYDAPQKESRLEGVGRESRLNRPGQIAGINPPAEVATGKGASSIGRSASSMTAQDWANQNEKFVTGGGAEGWGAHYDALDALGDDFGAKRQYMLDNPEFAAYEAARLKQKYNDAVPWWLEEYGRGGYKGYGRDYRDYGRGGGSGGNQWSRNYDEYEALGDDYDAKRQYMLDHPEFAAYELQRIKAKYGELPWWAKPYTPRSGGGGYGGYSYGGGGGGGGGSRTAPFPEGMPQVAPRFMDQRLWQAPGQGRPWVPYSNPSPDWLRAGDRLRPDMPRKWQRPKF